MFYFSHEERIKKPFIKPRLEDTANCEEMSLNSEYDAFVNKVY